MARMRGSWIKMTGAVMAFAIAASTAQAPGDISSVHAVEFTVTESIAVLYSNDKTKVYREPDLNSGVVTVIAKDLPVDVTGVTSNGWFRISLNGTYYVPGDGLVSRNANAVLTETDVTKLTKGTFSFYKNQELLDLDKNDVADMDENTYIKYLDSFLMGYAMNDFCILKDQGRYLKEVYDSEAKVDQKVAAMSMQSYLIAYRNDYLVKSLYGPFRNEKELKLALNRAIRYDISKFGAVYRNSSVGSDEDKIRKVMEKVVDDMKAEQGVSFSCSMKYGTYKTSDGHEEKGWTLEFTKKD